MKKILIVDDESDYLSLLEHVLKKEGYKVAGAVNGEEALKVYRSFEPDLVLLDVQLPDTDGFTLCRTIRKEGPRPDTPILFCTVRSAVAPVSEGLQSGGTDYILKPFEIQDLLERVRKGLGGG